MNPTFWLFALLALLIWNAVLFSGGRLHVRPISRTRPSWRRFALTMFPKCSSPVRQSVVRSLKRSSGRRPPQRAPPGGNPSMKGQPRAPLPRMPLKRVIALKKLRSARNMLSEFATVFPESVGDPALMSLLEAHHVTVDAKTPSKPWFITLLVDWGPMLLLVGYFVWMGRQAMRSQSSLFGFGQRRHGVTAASNQG